MHVDAKRSRIVTFDLLRGYFLFVIINDHLGYFPSVFEFFTGRGQLWASAAEGFFIISGLLVGYIYGPRMARSAWATVKKLWRRAFLLYAISFILTVVFVVWGNAIGAAQVKEGLWVNPALDEFLWKSLTLQYYYGWADFLPYYALFMFVAPLALYACVKRKAWLLLAASGLVWLLRGNSFEMSWQILFMGGMVVGWYLPKIEQTYRALVPSTKRWLAWSVYGATIMTVALSALSIRGINFELGLPFAHSAFVALDRMREFMAPFIVKWTLEPVRLATSVLWFSALYLFVRQHEGAITRITRGFFTALGEHSLFVYSLHAFVIFGIELIRPPIHNIVANTIWTIAVLGLIYGAARLQPLAKRTLARAFHSFTTPASFKQTTEEL